MKPSNESPPASRQNFLVVGIGASAGGLDAFKRFLKAIPEHSGMAYVLVQHLAPSRESILPGLLSRVTKIPVHEITNEIHLAPDHIYVIPANKTLTTKDGVLKLTPRKKLNTPFTVDVFLTSLAEVHRELAAGVILSGTGSDGTKGLKAIREHGGVTFAQDHESAAYGDMPQSAMDAEVVDYMLPPEKIPGKLLQISKMPRKRYVNPEEKLTPDEEAAFKKILYLIRQQEGNDFSYYKPTTIRRRIARRMTITKCETLADYLNFIQKDKKEQHALFQDLLIPVTSFFRDPKTFQELTETVFPALFKGKREGEPVRIWSAGCSTGEEAYSLAIALHEFLEGKEPGRQIQIFASDISEPAIEKARRAIYSKTDVLPISDCS